MTIKDFLSRTKLKAADWLRSHNLHDEAEALAEVDDEGLMSEHADTAQKSVSEPAPSVTANNQVMVKPVHTPKREPIEKLQEGFGRLIDQLRSVNEHLNRQITQHEELMNRLEQVPRFLQAFPAVAENQTRITEKLLEELKTTSAWNQQFMEAVERIPAETAKQTDALADIDHQLAAAADTDVQMVESFNKFNQTIDKLNQSAISQSDSILQMSRTFAASDRYLKYLMAKQNRRFMWAFVIAVGTCVLTILILTGVIIYLRQ